MDLSKVGRLGVWCWLDMLSATQAAEFAQTVERLGYSILWLPEAVGRDPFVLATFLASHTKTLRFATGIANLYARDPMTMNTLRKTTGELSGGRFILGIGVSHAHLVAGVRKHDYGKPVSTMRAYLEAMRGKPYMAPAPPSEPPIVLAALRPKMLALAAEMAQGAHPYFVPPEHTARAREILGKSAWLAPEQMVLLETDAAKARAVARANMKVYTGLPNYQNNLRWLGYTDADFADGGSDRLVDAIVAWGDEKAIASRIQAHLDAGANHVCIQPFRADGVPGPDLRILEALAPGK
ncbi:MAG TPA: TIGR03620 family F420-dependent LLM class oxidoreductase [Myxococcota bacterium]|jgi:probable F420-dependent oxidoreductase|nr:TIGR03620 family F420-dependent LLM class oxidoreductase [Myxococcota bacterium]